MKKKILNHSHYLLGVRFDNWIRLLIQNGFKIKPSKIPQALYITLMSLVLFPFALIEAAVSAIPVLKTKIRNGPVYVVGFWRTGTTFLQNTLSQDRRFGWSDPVSTATFSNCLLLRPILAAAQKNRLSSARPMDNMKYSLDLPMEEVFAQATITPLAIIQMLTFPQNYKKYVPSAFIADLGKCAKKEWFASYDYVLKKQTLVCRGKPLLLKSPDNTCRIKEIKQKYPEAKFINIYRDPYTVVMSTVNMFKKQTDALALQNPPENFEELIEDVVIEIYKRMYSELFEFIPQIPAGDYTEVRYEDLTKQPVKEIERIYGELGLFDFEEARESISGYLASVADYQKNRFELSPRLRDKINTNLRFCFDRYGYELLED